MRTRYSFVLSLLLLWGTAALAATASSISDEQAVSLARPDGTLQGTLLRPAGKEASLVVLLIAGSGPTDRNGNTVGAAGKNNSLRLLAQGLAEAGIASLRYDKFGIAASATGALDESTLRFTRYADDAAAWVDWLRSEQGFKKVAVLGHSEGATLGLLAARDAKADAYISVAGVGRNASDLLRGQLQGRLPPDLNAQSDRILQALQAGKTAEEVPDQLAILYRRPVQPYLISWFSIEPLQEIAKLQMPVAILQGNTDIQVSVEDAQLLAKAQPKAELHLIPGMNHVLKTAPAGDIRAYTDPSLPLSSGLMDAITDFLKRVTTSPGL